MNNWGGNTLNTRPLNPERQNEIRQMFAEHLDVYNLDQNSDSEHSVDACLEDTGLSELVNWANKKNKGTNLDPEVRKRKPVFNSPLSDYNVEWTRLNHSADSITPSSFLSSLTYPSNPSIPSFSTPTAQNSKRLSKTPHDLVKARMKKTVERLRSPRVSKLYRRETIPDNFLPTNFSTPVSNRQKKLSFFAKRQTDKILNDQVVSSSNEDAPVRNEKDASVLIANSPNKVNSSNKANQSNKNNELVSTTNVSKNQSNVVIPETQPHNSFIPETQSDDTVIPETQDNEIPDSQDDQENNPVQAQGTPQNTDQQAAPRSNLVYSAQRNHSRQPIRDKSPTRTPSKYMPSSTTPSRQQFSRTPSRIPISKTFRPIVHQNSIIPSANERDASPVGSQNEKRRREFIVVQTPNRPTPSIPTPATVVPAQNLTVNVHVNNSHPQSPSRSQQPDQITQTIRTHQDTENEQNAELDNGQRNGSNESVMTNDDSSNDEHQMIESNRSNTMPLDRSNVSVRRKLTFVKTDAEQSRRDTKTPITIDNLTRTITKDSLRVRSPRRTRQHTNELSAKNMSSILPPNSQTFNKTKKSIQNATYDVVNNGSAQSTTNVQPNAEGSSNEFSGTLGTSSNTGGSTYNINPADVPSNAILEPMETIDDENNAATNDQNDKQPTQKKQAIDVPDNFQPKIVLTPVPIPTRKSVRNSTANGSNLHASQSYIAPPPIEFQNDSNDYLVEGSPQSSMRTFQERLSVIRKFLQQQNQSLGSNPNGSRRVKRKPKNEDLAVVEKNLKELNKKRPSERPTARRLRSTSIDDDDDNDDNVEPADKKRTSQITTAPDSVFKVPSLPNAPASKNRKTKSMNVSKISTVNTSKSSTINTSETLREPEPEPEQQKTTEEIHVEVNIEPMDDDEFEANDHIEDIPSTLHESVQKESSPKRKGRRPKTTETKKPNRTTTTKAKKQVDIQQETEVTSSEVDGMRRSCRDRKISTVLQDRLRLFSDTYIDDAKKTVPVRHTAPVVKFHDDLIGEPPRKKLRTQSEHGFKVRRTTTLSSSKSTRSLKLSTIRESNVNNDGDKSENIKEFIESFPSMIRKKTFQKIDWWKKLLDLDHKEPYIYHAEDIDAEHLKTKDGKIEIVYTDKVEFREKDGVDYGFTPSAKRPTVGYMRFKGGASKVSGPSHAQMELHVLHGEFLIECDEYDIVMFAGCDATVPKGVSYGIKNSSDSIGIIQCVYGEPM